MNTTNNVVLITGGATGIGLALAKEFLKAENKVIICSRRESKLQEAKEMLPDLITRRCDLSLKEERENLCQWITENYPKLNILINNAGIQHEVDFTKGTEDYDNASREIETNFNAVVHLCALFVPRLMQKQQAAIVNVSSGLAFAPLAIMPVYCATKAALHSFSMTLRHQLRNSSVKVFELAPPIVDTELDQGARERRGQTDRGIPPEPVAEEMMKGLSEDRYEILVGAAANLKEKGEMMFPVMNR